MSRAGGENFPVAARLLSRRHREWLLAIYGFARLTDELGDELAGDRLAALDWLELELDRAFAGDARHELMVRLQTALRECRLPRAPFAALIEANRLDQRVSHYETWEQLRAYCELSANPVGQLVLHVFDLATPERVELSNEVCTALQLIEHVQDLGEDLARGRIYLPAEDLARFGCVQGQLASLAGSEGLRETIRFEVQRARDLLAAGRELVRGIPGRPKLAVAAFVAGGDAALCEIQQRDYDVLPRVPQANKSRRVRALLGVLRESRA
jgi:squalene synthase HpnC